MTQRARPPPSLRVSALHVFLLANVAVALPLYDALNAHANFFVARGSEPVDVLAFVALLSFALPALLVAFLGAVEVVIPALGRVVHLGLIASGVCLYLLRLLNAALALPSWALAPVVVVLALVATRAYASSRAVQLFVTVLSPAALLIPVLFVFYSPVAKIALDASPLLPDSLAGDRDPSIVFVVFDELPTLSLLGADATIDGRRFPNFARLASRSYWFRYASGASDTTPGAVTAITSGLHDSRGTIAGFRSQPRTVFTMLRDSHRVNGWEVLTRLVPPDLHRRHATSARPFAERMLDLLGDVRVVYLHQVLPIDLRAGIPSIDSAWARWDEPAAPGQGRNMKRARADFESFVTSIKPESNPTLHFIHAMIPHVPWSHLPSGKIHNRPARSSRWEDNDSRKTWRRGPESQMTRYHQRHLLQTAAVDRLLGILLDHLEREGLFDDVLLILTADHGKAFAVGHANRRPTAANYPELIFVPLFVKLPGQQAGVVSDINAQNVDILPTVADVLGGSPPWRTDGMSLLSAAQRPESKHFFTYSTERTDYPMAAAVTAFRKVLARNVDRFSLDDSAHDLYRFGPFLAMIGAETATFPHRREEFEVRFWRGSPRILLDPKSDVVPDHVLGFLPRETHGARRHVALSVNCVIAAVAALEPEGKESRFEAFLPEDLMRDGANVLEIHRVERNSKGEIELWGPKREPCPEQDGRPRHAREP